MRNPDVLQRSYELAVAWLRELPGRHVGVRLGRDALLGHLGGPLPEAGSDPIPVFESFASAADGRATLDGAWGARAQQSGPQPGARPDRRFGRAHALRHLAGAGARQVLARRNDLEGTSGNPHLSLQPFHHGSGRRPLGASHSRSSSSVEPQCRFFAVCRVSA